MQICRKKLKTNNFLYTLNKGQNIDKFYLKYVLLYANT